MKRKAIANRLNRRIQFLDQVKKRNDYGEWVKEDVVLFSCWAEFYSQNIGDKVATLGTVYENTVFFNVSSNMRQKIKKSYKIHFNELTYEIKDIDERISEEVIRITARAVV